MIKSKTSIIREVIARGSNKVYNTIELKGDFPKQDAFVNDPARYIDAQCSRRAGKTNGLALRYFKTMEKHPKSQCIYLGLTLESAREILWPVLLEINDKYNLGCTFTESRLTMRHPNGATLRLFGADMKNFIKRLKGRKYSGVGIDEAQDFGSHLESLVDDVLTPSISDYEDGWLALTGTPGPVPQGYFFDITRNKKYGFSHHEWTLMDNPHMPSPEQFLADLIKRKEWKPDHPTLLREWRNHWVLDQKALWIVYSETTNHYEELPTGHQWNYIMGVDMGFRDADAIAVLAWSETHPNTYLVEEIIKTKQGLTALTADIDKIQKKYNAYKIVLDEGGAGSKKFAEDVRQRFGCPLVAADKVRKQDNVELLNDELRLGKFKAKKDSTFVKDSYLVQVDWNKSTPKRTILKSTYHSDIIDAVLYAFRDSYGFNFKPEAKGPQYGSKEWADAQHDEMWEKELEGFQKDSEYANWLKNGQ